MDTTAKAPPTPGTEMGPKSTYRLACVTPTDKKTLNLGEGTATIYPKTFLEEDIFPLSDKKAFFSLPPEGLVSNEGQGSPPPENKKSYLSSEGSPLKGLVTGHEAPAWTKEKAEGYPIPPEGVLRIWGLRRYVVNGVEVIGWEVGMDPA